MGCPNLKNEDTSRSLVCVSASKERLTYRRRSTHLQETFEKQSMMDASHFTPWHKQKAVRLGIMFVATLPILAIQFSFFNGSAVIFLSSLTGVSAQSWFFNVLSFLSWWLPLPFFSALKK